MTICCRCLNSYMIGNWTWTQAIKRAFHIKDFDSVIPGSTFRPPPIDTRASCQGSDKFVVSNIACRSRRIDGQTGLSAYYGYVHPGALHYVGEGICRHVRLLKSISRVPMTVVQTHFVLLLDIPSSVPTLYRSFLKLPRDRQLQVCCSNSVKCWIDVLWADLWGTALFHLVAFQPNAIVFGGHGNATLVSLAV